MYLSRGACDEGIDRKAAPSRGCNIESGIQHLAVEVGGEHHRIASLPELHAEARLPAGQKSDLEQNRLDSLVIQVRIWAMAVAKSALGRRTSTMFIDPSRQGASYAPVDREMCCACNELFCRNAGSGLRQ
jgi:hypothetical protein